MHTGCGDRLRGVSTGAGVRIKGVRSRLTDLRVKRRVTIGLCVSGGGRSVRRNL